MSPILLSYDAALRLKNAEDPNEWNNTKKIHREVVRAAVIAVYWRKVLSAKLREERYGWNIIKLIFKNDNRSLFEIEKMLMKKTKGTLDAFEKLHGYVELNRRGKQQSGINSEVAHDTIMNKISSFREKKPSLSDFLPDELPSHIHERMKDILSPYEELATDINILSEVARGSFRHLRIEFRMDVKNEIEKLRTQKRDRSKDFSIQKHEENEDENEEDGFIPPLFSPADQFKIAGGNTPREINENLIKHIEQGNLIEIVEKELERPENRKLKEIFLKYREHLEISDIDLAASLNLHRNTVRNRKKELRRIIANKAKNR